MGKGSYILGKVFGCRVIPNILEKGSYIMGNCPRIMGNGSNFLGRTVIQSPILSMVSMENHTMFKVFVASLHPKVCLK